jgi:hypothetical protein
MAIHKTVFSFEFYKEVSQIRRVEGPVTVKQNTRDGSFGVWDADTLLRRFIDFDKAMEWAEKFVRAMGRAG